MSRNENENGNGSRWTYIRLINTRTAKSVRDTLRTTGRYIAQVKRRKPQTTMSATELMVLPERRVEKRSSDTIEHPETAYYEYEFATKRQMYVRYRLRGGDASTGALLNDRAREFAVRQNIDYGEYAGDPTVDVESWLRAEQEVLTEEAALINRARKSRTRGDEVAAYDIRRAELARITRLWVALLHRLGLPKNTEAKA